MGTTVARITLAALALWLYAGALGAANLKVLSTIALRESWHELKPLFEARGHKLHVELQTSGALGKRIMDGEAADVIVSTTAGIDGLAKAGKAHAATAKPFASSAAGIAVLKGAPKPDISTPEALKRTLLAAKSVAYSNPAGGGASGAHFAKVLERLGVAGEVNARARLVPGGNANAEELVKGNADLAVQQIPELLGVAGVDVVGPFPGEFHAITAFSAAVLATSGNADAAKALVDFLASPEVAALLKARGFEASR